MRQINSGSNSHNRTPTVAIVLLLCLLPMMGQSTQPASQPTTSPATQPERVNETESDVQAIVLAEETLITMGGQDAWDQTRYIEWNFFGFRKHTWDKHTGNVRIEYTDRETSQTVIILMNIHDNTGRVWADGEEVTDQTKVKSHMESGYAMWVNDSYWLVMPYKLKDPGVTLKYNDTAKMEDGREADVITLTFKDVGLTPQNKYDVYIATDDHLVGQWSYYKNMTDEEPMFTSPWLDWKKHGRIMLSGGRGEDRRLTEIAVFDKLPDSVFTNPESR